MTEDAQGLTMLRTQVIEEVAPAAKVPVTFTVYELIQIGLEVNTENCLLAAVKVIQLESKALLSESVELQVKAPHSVTELVQSVKV